MAEDLSDKTPAQADWKVVAPQAASEEVKRILKDPVFHYSQRCKSLLKYIVDKSLKGQHQELKERIIGIEVFGRSPDYDTSNDATVRVAVNEVRKRLSQYYSKAEHKQELRIDIPVRSYVAEFNPPGRGPDKALTHNGYRVFGRWYLWAAAAVVILGLAAWMIVQSPFRVSAIDEFWAPLLSSSRSISICVGMPLNTKWDSTESKPLPDPTTQNAPTYANDQRIIVDKEDIAGGEQFLAYLHQKGKEAVIRPSQGFDLAALQSDSLILEGMYMNEWAERFWPDLHFQFRKDPNVDLRWIEGTNDSLAPKKWSVNYTGPEGKNTGNDYALISRIRDQASGRWWIGVGALTRAGTRAANQMVLDPKSMAAVGATLPLGWEKKNVQIVLEIKLVQGNAGAIRVIATSTW